MRPLFSLWVCLGSAVLREHLCVARDDLAAGIESVPATDHRSSGTDSMTDTVVHRERWDIKAVAIILTLTLQVSALVWGAATINSAVNSLEVTSAELRESVRELIREVGNNDARLRVLEDRATVRTNDEYR